MNRKEKFTGSAALNKLQNGQQINDILCNIK
jgi:hypothetical protein